MIQIYLMCLIGIMGGMALSLVAGFYLLWIALKQKWIVRSVCTALIILCCFAFESIALVWTLHHGPVLR